MNSNITTIAFDADDTLWVNEPYFRESEDEVANILSDYKSRDEILDILLHTNVNNIPKYGYGVKGFILNLVEAVDTITEGTASFELLKRVLQVGIKQLDMPMVLIPGVEETLQYLQDKYRLVVATKGDLQEQKAKFVKSGLSHFFSHFEVMDEKTEENYRTLLNTLNCKPENFLMVGNSLKSDILPVLNIGANAVHIPFHSTWAHELIKEEINSNRLTKLTDIKQIIQFTETPNH